MLFSVTINIIDFKPNLSSGIGSGVATKLSLLGSLLKEIYQIFYFFLVTMSTNLIE